MNAYRVIISAEAQEQITAQVFYIAKDSIPNALRWEARLQSAIDGLADVPGHAVDEQASQRLGFTVQKATFEKTYLIHYVLDSINHVVRVVNFRHGATRPRRGEP